MGNVTTIDYRKVIGPAFYRAWNDFMRGWYIDPRDGKKKELREQVFSGGRGCIDGDTLIQTPRGLVQARYFEGGELYAFDGEKIVVASAWGATAFTREKMYEVMLENGAAITVTDEHKFLTADGWKMTKDLIAGTSRIAVGDTATFDSAPHSEIDVRRFSLDEHLDGIKISPEMEKKGQISLVGVESIEFSKEDVYYDIFVPHYNNYLTADGIVNHNSLKSSAVSVFLIMGIERDAQQALALRDSGEVHWRAFLTHAIVFRKFASDLATSVFGQMQWAISKLELDDEYIITKTPLKIVKRLTGQTILFRGLDDPTKIKSLKPPSGFGYFKYLWCEEWDQFDGMEEIRSVRQSVLRGGHKFQTFYSFNPPETSSNWANAEISKEIDGRLVYRSDFRSVPRQWLGDNFFVEAALTLKQNVRAFRHEYLGEVTGNGGSVFPLLHKMAITDEMIRNFSYIRMGIDWGFAIDPATWVICAIDMKRRAVFIFDELYGQGWTNPYFASLVKDKVKAWGRPYDYIYCDAAEPKSIAEFEQLGVNVLAAPKGPDSVRFSLKALSGFDIYIDPVRCEKAWEEFSQYEYKKDRGGNFISAYVDARNHIIDAVRYACITDLIEGGFMEDV